MTRSRPITSIGRDLVVSPAGAAAGNPGGARLTLTLPAADGSP
ncbi:hypothetical protein [Planomonospora sp. ID67723]|nr:hypothetical protein [Planomonospora sp. ID67723]